MISPNQILTKIQTISNHYIGFFLIYKRHYDGIVQINFF